MKNRAFTKDGMFRGANAQIFKFAKELRQNMTEAEKALWLLLKGSPNGYKFRRQHPLGSYIADFYCHKAKIVIEVDGLIHQLEQIKLKDSVRQRTIEEFGIKVIRFTNKEVLEDPESVLQRIKTYLINEISSL